MLSLRRLSEAARVEMLERRLVECLSAFPLSSESLQTLREEEGQKEMEVDFLALPSMRSPGS